MAQNKKNEKSMNRKQKRIIMITAVVVIVLLAGAMIVSAAMNAKKNSENTAGVTLNEKKLKNTESTTVENTEKTTVEITIEDCAVPVGTVFQATAVVTPQNTDKALQWSSDHEDVFTVDEGGMVTIVGTGMGVLTATVGDVSDAVILEGISSVSQGSKNDLPVYTADTLNELGALGLKNAYDNSNSSEQNNSGSSGNNLSNDSSYNNSDNENDGDLGSGTDSGLASGSGSNNGLGSNGSNSENNSSGSNSESDNSDKVGMSSTGIAGALPGMGFSNDVSNVYVYNEGDNYCGEVITQPNVTIIYIKNRSAGFDSKIQSILSQLVEGDAGQVWSNYLSATNDRTLTAAGRKVRIVTSINGDHSQIVIYN